MPFTYATHREYYQRDKDARRAAARERWASGSLKRLKFKSALKLKYGLTVARYENMLVQQRGGCAICGKPPSPSRGLAVDHDHLTGQVRGLLCDRCNTSIGMLDDNWRMLARAAEYLRGHNAAV